MSSNTIRARLAFSFKAENYELDTILALDRCVGEIGEEPNFHLLLARTRGIDPYSYLYEVLESHEIVFSDPTGVAAQSCRDGGFDWPRFERDWREELDLQAIRVIAEERMGVRDLDGRSDLKAALLAAYRAGKASRPA